MIKDALMGRFELNDLVVGALQITRSVGLSCITNFLRIGNKTTDKGVFFVVQIKAEPLVNLILLIIRKFRPVGLFFHAFLFDLETSCGKRRSCISTFCVCVCFSFVLDRIGLDRMDQEIKKSKDQGFGCQTCKDVVVSVLSLCWKDG